MKHKLLSVLIITVAVGIVLFGSVSIYAQTNNGSYPPMISALAKKLGIGEDKVKAAFEAVRSEQQANRKKQYQERLNRLVKEGKITEEQKKLIIAKNEELKNNRLNKESMQKLTPEERKNKMKSEKQALENWAKANGIDLKYLFGGFGRMRGPKGILPK